MISTNIDDLNEFTFLDFDSGTIRDSAIVKDLTEFTCFPRLPIEIQTMIWKEHKEEREIVKISYKDMETTYGYHYGAWFAKYKIPTLLHVSLDARSVAISSYKLAYWNILDHYNGVYMDFKRDALSFDDARDAKDFFELGGEHPESRLKVLLLGPKWYSDESENYIYPEDWEQMGKPKETHFVRDNHTPDELARYNFCPEFACEELGQTFVPDLKESGKRCGLIERDTSKRRLCYVGKATVKAIQARMDIKKRDQTRRCWRTIPSCKGLRSIRSAKQGLEQKSGI